MSKESVNCDKLPPAIGPYSHAVRSGNVLYVSGQIPLEPASGELVTGSVKDQTERVLANIGILLGSLGLTMGDVVKTTVFLVDMASFAEMNEVYARHFTGSCPARSTVAVRELPRSVSVEIDCIAVFPESA
jgi:2-iminobutanoate/2-iminopropanoate deaminase